MKLIEWTPSGSITLPVVHADGDLWFTHKSLAMLFGVTKANICTHVRDLQQAGQLFEQRLFTVSQPEGGREVVRRTKHVSLETAHAIAIRGLRLAELNRLVDFAVSMDVVRPVYRIAPIKERSFREMLVGALDGITVVRCQCRLSSYVVDFYLPAWRLVVEYDERYHSAPRVRQADLVRQQAIETQFGVDFIRVSVGQEIQGLNSILKHGMFEAKAVMKRSRV